MSGGNTPREEGSGHARVNGYVYREHTRDFLFNAAERNVSDANGIQRDIKNNFTQDLIDEETMSTNVGESSDDHHDYSNTHNTADITSIHTHKSEEISDEEREAVEEAERLKEPFRVFTTESYKRLERQEKERKLKEETNNGEDEGRLVDGEIVFDEDTSQKLDRDPKLADGQPLPEKLGRFPKELVGVPLEEIDPYIKVKSFVAIAKKFKNFTIFRFSATKSLFLFAPWNPIRKFCIQVVCNQYFDLFILLTIVVNCVLMAMKVDPNDTATVNALNILEYVFQGVYTLEMIIKIISKGFIINKYTYLRDGWNWLDFLVVILAFVTITLDQLQLGDVQLSGLRAFRVLRALKSISVVPGLRTIVNALLKSLKMLAEVMLLTLFCISVFALFALQLYMGSLRNKCVEDIPATYDFCNATNATQVVTPCFSNETHFKNWWLQQEDKYLTDDEGSFVICGTIANAMPCPDGYSCFQTGPNPNNGITHFDNFPWAVLNTFQLVTLDFWEDTYNKIIDANGPWNMLYFMMVVLLGSFYLVNLMLAVVAMAYEQEADVEAKLAAEEEAEEKAKAKRKENTAMLFDPKKLKQQLLQKQKEEEAAKNGGGQEGAAPDAQPTDGLPNGGSTVQTKNNRPVTAKGEFLKTSSGQPTSNTNQSQDKMELTEFNEPERGHTPSPTKTHSSVITAGGINAELQSSNTLNGVSTTKLGTDPELGDEEEDDDAFHDDLPDIGPRHQRYLIQKYATLWFNKIKPDDEKLIDRNCLCCSKPGWGTYHNWVKFQNIVYKVANDGLFELFITLCIIANTIIMATELYDPCEQCRHCPAYNPPPSDSLIGVGNYTKYGRDIDGCSICPHSMCGDVDITGYSLDQGFKDSHYNAMDISNVVFTIIFLMEAIIKLTALSKEYFKVGWNNFDLFIVVCSMPDLIIYFGNFGNVDGISSVSGIVKIFRLMRIIKLAQSWSTMKTLLGIIFQTMGALGNLTAILGLIIFIFAVLGNQLLGDSYHKFTEPELGGALPRWHLYDFFHSFLMVFRVLCGEWIEPLWDCILASQSAAGCSAFFLGTLVIGNFMVLNLFLALLLNAFTTDNIKDNSSTEESKMVASIKNLIRFCKNGGKPARAVTPTSESNLHGSQISITSRPRTRLEAILDNGKAKPAVTINGSTHSIKQLIEATEPHKETRNGSVVSDKRDDNGVELKPYTNGHTKTSRSGSVISILSNGTNVSNGVLKNNKSVNMSPENLKQIENAFTTNRSEYAQFETSMDASAPKPVVFVKDENGTEKKTLFSDNEDNNEEEKKVETVPEAGEPGDEDKEDKLVLEDGTVNLPDCCCAVCHRNPKWDNCCTPVWTSHRELWAKVVTHPAFEGFIIFLIFASSITLCFEDNTLHEKQILSEALNYLNIVFAVFFFVEMLLKWIAYGFKKYFTSFWTILDFVIVQVAIIDLLGSYLGFADISAFKTLRVLRALRPLRAISRWQNMKIVVNALIFALPAIGNVFVVIIVFWLIFAIYGVQTFKGIFYQCTVDDERVPASRDPAAFAWVCNSTYLDMMDPPFDVNSFDMANFGFPPSLNMTIDPAWPSNLADCTDNDQLKTLKWAGLCERLGGDWSRPLVHMDNVLYAYLALFQVATFEGWMEVMEAAIDAPLAIGGQAFLESRLYWYFYFLIFIVFGAFFTLNLFIGVIIENFNELKKKYDGSYLAAFLTESQRHYYNTLKNLGNKKPQKTIRRPKNKFQAFFFDIAVDTRFEITITIVIFLNMLVMMLDYMPAPDTDKGEVIDGEYVLLDENLKAKQTHATMNIVTEYINMVFTFIFVLEAIIKIIGLRWHYFRRAWNVFDFVVVALSLLGIVLEKLFAGEMFISPTLLRVVRVFRIGRVLRLVKSAKGIRKLLFALIISIPALFNIAILLFLFMFIFSVIGMTMFSKVRHVGALTETINFDTFPNSMVLLFRLSTSAGWNDILDTLQDPGSGCNSTHYLDTLGVPQTSQWGNCGNETVASIFLILYLFLSFMIIINMYIAVILENFTQAHEQEEIGITDDDFDMFYVIWEKYDPLATQYIKLDQLSDFLADLEDPLGVPKPNGMAIVAFNLPIVEGDRIHCLDVLMALVRRILHTSEEETPNMSQEHKDANEKLKQQIADKYRAAFPQRQKIKVLSTTMQRKKEDVAAKTLQRAWRKHRMKQNIMNIRQLALDQSQRDSISHRLSETLGSIKSRIGSAVSRISRRGSTRSIKSIDSHTLKLPPELQHNNNRLSPNAAAGRSVHNTPR